MNIKSITRTAAIMYADTMSTRTTRTIKQKIIESIYVNNNNTQLTLSELANCINEELGLLFSEDEIKQIIKGNEAFVEVLNRSSEDIKYNLQMKRYNTLCSKPTNEFDKIIETFFQERSESTSLTKDMFKELIYKYLHSILNTNISAYSHFINPSKGGTKVPKLNSEHFTDDEIDLINDFITWKNEEKDKAIFEVVNYCIEYAIVVNDSSEEVLSRSLKTKVFFLDNSLIYRALGINGKTRKARTLSFLKKCKDSGQQFIISKYTRMEFFNTIDYHLKQLNSSTPFGRINPQVFKRYSNGEGFYQFYHEWRNGRINYGFDMFKTHIHTLYRDLVKTYGILEDFKVPFDEQYEPKIIIDYKNEIQSVKGTYKEDPHLMDARNMYWIECVRNNNSVDVASTKYYFVTSDQKLQLWDSQHSKNQPLTLLPSQWMGLLLKYVSRSSDDFKSFISFMNLPKDNSPISEDELQSIMAGISEMTEDFSKQESIIESMMEVKFEDILQGGIQENAKMFAKNKLEEDFAKQIVKREEETKILLANKEDEKNELSRTLKEEMAKITEESKRQFEIQERERKQEKLRMVKKEIRSLNIRKGNADIEIRYKISVWIVICILIIVFVVAIWFSKELPMVCAWLETYPFFIYLYYIINVIITVTPLIVGIVVGIVCSESFSPIQWITAIKSNITAKTYVKYDYTQNELDEFKELQSELENQLK